MPSQLVQSPPGDCLVSLHVQNNLIHAQSTDAVTSKLQPCQLTCPKQFVVQSVDSQSSRTAHLNTIIIVTWSSGLAKTIQYGTVQGGRWRGRQRKRWEDNIKEWTGLEWNIILRKAKNSKEWRKLVVKSTVMPQQSARLQDRWDEMRSLLLTLTSWAW